MEAAKRVSYRLPNAWIDRIFARLTEIYGERFTSQFTKPQHIEMEKVRWASGLYGLNSEQIKNVLNLCLNNYIKEPPNVIDFFKYGKEYKFPPPIKPAVRKADKATQAHHMQLIREKLGNKKDSANSGVIEQDKSDFNQ